jgi:hypothetical protein
MPFYTLFYFVDRRTLALQESLQPPIPTFSRTLHAKQSRATLRWDLRGPIDMNIAMNRQTTLVVLLRRGIVQDFDESLMDAL